MDWSHPLLQIQFEQLSSNNPPSVSSVKTPVVWNGDIYALGRDHLNRGSLLKYSISHNEWSITLVPSKIYTSYSVLTTYLSELILISGQNWTIWEFDYNCNVFKESCIPPVPGPKHSMTSVATSEDKYLIVAPGILHLFDELEDDDHDHTICVQIFDGSSWRAQQYDLSALPYDYGSSMIRWTTFIGNRTMFVAWCNDEGSRVLSSIYKAPLLLGECDVSMTIIKLEIYVEEIDYPRIYPQHSLFLLNNQLFIIDSQGIIHTTYMQPPIGVIWILNSIGNSISFRQAPHIVALPNGELLVVGIVMYYDHKNWEDQSERTSKSQLDVINVHRKGI